MRTSNRSVAMPMRRTLHLLVVALFALLAIGVALQARAQAQAPAGDPPGRVGAPERRDRQGLALQPRRQRMGRHRPQPAADHGRPIWRPTTARMPRSPSARRRCASTRPPSCRSCSSTTPPIALHLQNGSVALRMRNPQSLAEFALETDDGQFRVQAVGQLSLRPLRPDQRPHRLQRPGRLRGPEQRPAAHARATRPVLDRCRRRSRNTTWSSPPAMRSPPGTTSVTAPRPVLPWRRGMSLPEMTGADDLDRYGQWQQSPDYGPLWAPTDVPRRMGALQRRPLGLDPALGLDLGRRCALGLRAVPLRPLGQLSQPLVLGTGHLRRPPGLRAGAGRLDRRRARRRLDRHRPDRRSAGSRSRRTRSTCRPTGPARATCAK